MGVHDKAIKGRYKSEPKGYELEIVSSDQSKGLWLGWLTLPNGRQVSAEGTFKIKYTRTWSGASIDEGKWNFTSLTMKQNPEDPEESWYLECDQDDYGDYHFHDDVGEKKIRYVVWRGHRAGPENAPPHTPYVFTRILPHTFPLE